LHFCFLLYIFYILFFIFYFVTELSMAEKFDIVVIGGGSGGYAAAIRCAQRKVSVALIEKKSMGGVCLNIGCIPSKALLATAHTFLHTKRAAAMGIDVAGASPNWPKIQQRKNAIVTQFVKGLTGLVQANKIKIFKGRGICTSPTKVKIESNSGTVELEAAKIILATGSEPIDLPAIGFDGTTIISSTEALSLPAIPASMVIIGGGVIGCEMASFYAAMGTKVTVVEALLQLLPNEEPWVAKILSAEFKKLGIESLVGQTVQSVDKTSSPAKVILANGQSLNAEKVLVAVGRRAVCDKETIDALGLKMNGKVIAVNDKMETNVPGVYALGDVVGTTYLAHGAFAEAHVVAANATGSNETMYDYNLIPRVIYSFPEVASVGMTEAACAAKNMAVTIGKAYFRSNGRAAGENETVGEIRVIRDNASNKAVGVSMIGNAVTELVGAARAMLGTAEPIERVMFPHPTISEVLRESWEAAYGASLHLPPKA
jgi:dihydrolipoamide dehydrogenase